LLVASVVLSSAIPTLAAEICRPALGFKEVRFSGAKAQQRTWTATLAVDASHCASTSGPFFIGIMRSKEDGPDAIFVERFTWKPEQVEVSVTFWQDEAVVDHWINSVPECPCRGRE
jgi:hypothetical protein